MKTTAIEIVTPDQVYLKEDADFVVLPGADGELGILPGHMRLIAQIAPGNVRIVKGTDTKRYIMSAGFADIGPTAIKVFTTMIRPVTA